MRVMMIIFLAMLGIWGGGFGIFMATLERTDNTIPSSYHDVYLPHNARIGIVALTGGGGTRIREAVGLLEQGVGERLFITGVHPDTTVDSLANLLAIDKIALKCCVDLDHHALTTRGNAIEIFKWVNHNRYDAIIIVTTDYHMPRAKIEITRLLPDIPLYAHAVASKIAPANSWIKSPTAWWVLTKEYTKFLLVYLSQILPPNPAT